MLVRNLKIQKGEVYDFAKFLVIRFKKLKANSQKLLIPMWVVMKSLQNFSH